MIPNSPGKPVRNVQLDVLRCIAILGVIGAHIKVDNYQGVTGWIARIWDGYGWLGVRLFFTLSGYLISGLILDELRVRGNFNIKRFFIRRGFKLYPAYLVLLAYLIAMPTLKAFVSGGAGNGLSEFKSMLTDFWPNFLFLQNYIGPNPAVHTWSLAVEEHFYILLPILILWLARRGQVRQLTAIGLLSPVLFTIVRYACYRLDDPYMTKQPFVFATHLGLDALAIGVGLRSLKEFSPAVFEALGRWRWLLVLVGAVLMFLPNWILPNVTVGAAMVLLGVLHMRATDFGFLARPGQPVIRLMAWIGVYSYSIYLWHSTFMGIASKTIISHLHLDPARPVDWFLNRILIVTAIIIGGWVAARLIEWPALKIRDRYFPTRASAPVAGAAEPVRSVPAVTNCP